MHTGKRGDRRGHAGLLLSALRPLRSSDARGGSETRRDRRGSGARAPARRAGPRRGARPPRPAARQGRPARRAGKAQQCAAGVAADVCRLSMAHRPTRLGPGPHATRAQRGARRAHCEKRRRGAGEEDYAPRLPRGAARVLLPLTAAGGGGREPTRRCASSPRVPRCGGRSPAGTAAPSGWRRRTDRAPLRIGRRLRAQQGTRHTVLSITLDQGARWRESGYPTG